MARGRFGAGVPGTRRERSGVAKQRAGPRPAPPAHRLQAQQAYKREAPGHSGRTAIRLLLCPQPVAFDIAKVW